MISISAKFDIYQLCLVNPFVKEAAVKLIEEGEKQYLVAYIVGQEGLDLSLLQVYVNERLVNRVKLNIFVQLEAFPLTVNGKIDRHSLPRPNFSKREYVPPQTETESLLVSLWEDVLREKVGITDNFFELGGDSLMATYIVLNLAKLSDIHLLPTILFEYPTIEVLGTYIDGLQSNIITYTNNYVTTSVTYAPATYAQERVMKWLESSAATLPYHLPSVYRLQGTLNIEALQQSFAYLVQRHAALRTRLLWKDDRLFQSIEPQISIDFQIKQLSDQQTIGDYIIIFLYQTFDLTQEPALPDYPLHPIWEANIDWTASKELGLMTVKTPGAKQEYPLDLKSKQDAIAQLFNTLISGETKVLNDLSEITIVGHRVVHGGSDYSEATLIDQKVKSIIRDLIPLAPSHNPAHLEGIEAVETLLGNVPQIGCKG